MAMETRDRIENMGAFVERVGEKVLSQEDKQKIYEVIKEGHNVYKWSGVENYHRLRLPEADHVKKLAEIAEIRQLCLERDEESSLEEKRGGNSRVSHKGKYEFSAPRKKK